MIVGDLPRRHRANRPLPPATTLSPVRPRADRRRNGEAHPVAHLRRIRGRFLVLIVEAGIERLGLTCRLQILGQLPSLEDRLDLGDEGGDLGPELGVGFSGFEEVQELFADEIVECIVSAELGLDLSGRFALLDPDLHGFHRHSSRCCSQWLRIASACCSSTDRGRDERSRSRQRTPTTASIPRPWSTPSGSELHDVVRQCRFRDSIRLSTRQLLAPELQDRPAVPGGTDWRR